MAHADYLSSIMNVNDREKVLHLCKQRLRELNLEFDSIAVMGISGITIGSILAYHLNKKLVIIRKDNEITHSGYRVEYFDEIEKYIIIDDLISTGTTMFTIIKKIKQVQENSIFIGILLYKNGYDNLVEFQKP